MVDASSTTSKDKGTLSIQERLEIFNQWVLNLGTWFHMTSHRDRFHTYRSC